MAGRHVAPLRTPAQRLGASISRFEALDPDALRHYVTDLVCHDSAGTARLVTGMLGLDAEIDAAVDRVPCPIPAQVRRTIDIRDAL